MITNATGIRCGHCKDRHPSVTEVRRCAGQPSLPLPRPVRDRDTAESGGTRDTTEWNRVYGSKAHFAGTSERSFVPHHVADSRDKIRNAVPGGRYALVEEGKVVFYHVEKGKGRWDGYTFVRILAGDNEYRIRNSVRRQAVLQAIVNTGIETAMLRYGREIGQCGHCGRTLTNEESRALGIGPICRGKMGW